MATIVSTPTQERSSTRTGWPYLGKLAISAFGILLCLVTIKFFTEHLLAPRNMGLNGALVQRNLDLLLIGSSHTRQSYDIRLLEKTTGLSAFALAYNGDDLKTMSQIIDYLVSRPDRCPRYIVVEAYSALLGRKPDLQDPRYFFDAPPALKMRIIRTYLSEHRRPSALLDVFDLVVNRGNEAIVTYPVNSLLLKRLAYRGGPTGIKTPGVSAEQFSHFTSDATSGQPDPVQLAALYRIIDIAEHHNISVIFIESPLPKPVSSDPKIQALKADFREILEAHHLRYINGDLDFPNSDPSMFEDNNHLSAAGREKFTLDVSADLKTWIASLPKNRAAAISR